MELNPYEPPKEAGEPSPPRSSLLPYIIFLVVAGTGAIAFSSLLETWKGRFFVSLDPILYSIVTATASIEIGLVLACLGCVGWTLVRQSTYRR